jgi:hypothetical protein
MRETALAIADLLNDLGFDSPAAQARARDALVAGRLTTPAKLGIAADKRPRVEELLRATFLVTCGAADCGRSAAGREVVVAHDRRRCWICGGSDNRRAVDRAAAIFRERGIRKIVVVGGSPGVHEQLRELAPGEWELRLIDGTERRTSEAARFDLRWADLVIVWGGSELNHKVSAHYTGTGPQYDRVIAVSRRGIAALLDGAVTAVRGQPWSS